MSNETLEIIKKYISDALSVELIRADSPLGKYSFNARIGGNIVVISMYAPFVEMNGQADGIKEYLKEHNIIAAIDENPGCNISLNLGGIVVEPRNN